MLFLSCLTTDCKQRNHEGELPAIDVIGNLGTSRQVLMSELIEEVEYIPLETEERCLIARTDHLIVTDTHIFIGGYDHCYAFTREGKFISDIGRVGRGPGEWPWFGKMSVDEKNRLIYLDTSYAIFEYTWDGKFLRTITKSKFPQVYASSSDAKRRGDEPVTAYDVVFLRDNLFLGHIFTRTGLEPYKWVIFDDTGSTVKTFDNHIKLDKEPGSNSIFAPWTMVQSESAYVKEGINDTIFVLNRRDELIPRYVFDLGRYAFPLDKHLYLRDPYSQESVLITNFRGYMVVLRDKILFAVSVGYSTGLPRQQGVSRQVSVRGFNAMSSDNGIAYGLYDIDSGKTDILDRDPVTRKLGLINDIDGGLSFWSAYYNESRNELVDVLEAYEMKDRLTEEYLAAHPAKDPAAHERLRMLLKNLKETDNPVIVIAKLKK
jgi:hypothetical protein